MVEDCAFSHKIDYVTIFKEILNLEGHQNCITGARVTAISLNGWILPSAVEGLLSTGPTPSSFLNLLVMVGRKFKLPTLNPSGERAFKFFWRESKNEHESDFQNSIGYSRSVKPDQL